VDKEQRLQIGDVFGIFLRILAEKFCDLSTMVKFLDEHSEFLKLQHPIAVLIHFLGTTNKQKYKQISETDPAIGH
jgi:hypothetical protein